MSQGWMRIRDAAHLMGVSQTTVRRRVDTEELRGRVGTSGRQEVFLPVKLRRELEAQQAGPATPGHLDRGKSVEEADAEAVEQEQQALADAALAGAPAEAASDEPEPSAEVLKKFERLAGGSLILAQQRSDELQKHTESAYEQLAHTRSQVRQLRRVALAGWAGCAAAIIFGTVLSVTFGLGMAKAQAEADVNRAHTEQVQQRADTMVRRRPGTAPANVPAPAAITKDEQAASATPMSVPELTGSEPMRTHHSGPGRTVAVPTE